jgi:hypothetical protein
MKTEDLLHHTHTSVLILFVFNETFPIESIFSKENNIDYSVPCALMMPKLIAES